MSPALVPGQNNGSTTRNHSSRASRTRQFLSAVPDTSTVLMHPLIVQLSSYKWVQERHQHIGNQIYTLHGAHPTMIIHVSSVLMTWTMILCQLHVNNFIDRFAIFFFLLKVLYPDENSMTTVPKWTRTESCKLTAYESRVLKKIS